MTSIKATVVNFLNKVGFDGCVLKSDENRFWYSQFMSSAGYILINKDGQSVFLIDGRYFYSAQDQAKNVDEVRLLQTGLLSNLEEICKQLKITKLGLEAEYTNLNDLNLFKKIQGIEIHSFESAKLRQQKRDEELEALQKAADIVALTEEWIQQQKIVGLTEKQVATMIDIHMLELGAEKNSFDSIVASGKNGAIPHHKPNDKVIEDGDMVTVDIGCIYNGYCSDITRSFIAGDKSKANKELLDIYNIVLKAQLAGIQAAKVGMTGGEIDSITRNVINQTKYKDYFTHSTGHGVGIEVHEYPYISKNYNETILDRSVFTVEPGIYVPGLGGVRIEDTIYVDYEHKIVLTRLAGK